MLSSELLFELYRAVTISIPILLIVYILVGRKK